MKIKEIEYKSIYVVICILFFFFLFLPLGSLLIKSFVDINGNISLGNYLTIFQSKEFLNALGNSFFVSIAASVCSVLFAFLLAYTVNFTNVYKPIKKCINMVAALPMLLPTITYGFAIIYSFGKQGLLTKLLGFQLFDIYGFQGILLGYLIYTLPISFMLINNAMQQIDKKYITVSRLMNDSPFRTFQTTILRPLFGTFVIALIQSFFLSFTDFGIPASVGGKYEVVASLLYSYMLGSIPDFASGSVIAVVMLLPSIVSIVMMRYMERFNIRYKQISDVPLKKGVVRDVITAFLSCLVCIGIISVFLVILIVPFVEQWPYNIHWTTQHFKEVFADETLVEVFKNTFLMAIFTSVIGTLVSYGAALISQRSKLKKSVGQSLDSLALITNTIPGMVIGLSYLFLFTGTSLQNTLLIMILCNIVHFFSTPYMMMKETLGKMNASFETTAKLMKDSWIKTILRVITPNAKKSLIEVFCYYFVNSMVTVSAIIFLAGARTMVITTKIKELQYFAKFDQIFVLSLCILLTNLIIKIVCGYIQKKEKRNV